MIVEQYIENGYRIHPLRPHSKAPIYKEWPQMEVTINDLKALFGKNENVGLMGGEAVFVDFDDKAAARPWYSKHRKILGTVVETRKGIHAWFRATEEVRNGKHKYGDIRGSGGYVVAPDSDVDGWQYKFVKGHELWHIDDLPFFDPSILEYDSSPLRQNRKVTNIDAYLAKIESVEGQNGSAGLCRAVQACVDAGLSEAGAMEKIIEWNQSGAAKPQWSLREITHAVERVFKNNGG